VLTGVLLRERTGGRVLLLKHAPLVVAFCVALVAVLCARDTFLVDPPLLWAGVAVMGAATALVLALARWAPTHRLTILVPVLSMLAIGLFRIGTGGTLSVFTVMLVLPVVWIAGEDGRRYIVLAAATSAAALSLPYLLGDASVGGLSDPRAAWRAVYVPVVFALAAVTVNELSRRVRLQVAVLQDSERRLRAADRLTRSVLDAVTEQSVIGTDLDGLIDVWNPGAAAMLGLGPLATQGQRHVVDFHRPAELRARRDELGLDEATGPFAVLVARASQGVPDVREWTYVRVDHREVPVEVAVTRRLGEDGEPIGYLFVAADVTRAQEAVRVKDEFLGSVSHELRTPVSSVLGYLELVRDDPVTDDQSQYLDIAERNARRLLRLVNELLLSAQVDSGRFSVDASDVDLTAIVAGSVQSAGPAAARAGSTVTEDLAAHPPVIVRGDVLRLAQVCDNLLSNALKFTPRGGRVTVRLAIDDGCAVLTVGDTGVGIPADDLDRLWDRFFRAGTAISNAVPGVGLGLSITRSIVDAHGGTIAVASEVGAGTTFTVRIPLAEGAGLPA
jgi:signal transduction histidine kinase